MKTELQNKLYEKYPKIFRQKDDDMKQTCMCWGMECCDGWYDIIDELCANLQFNTDNNVHPQVEFVQVKEKYGRLTIYTQINPKLQKSEKLFDFISKFFIWIVDKLWSRNLISWQHRINYSRQEYIIGLIEGLIDMSECMSEKTCEICGKKAVLCEKGGWYKTLCEEHEKEMGYDKTKIDEA